MLRHTLHFYRSFAIAPVLITMASAFVYWKWGTLESTLTTLVFLKLVTNLLIGSVVHATTEKKRYYYYNLGISSPNLWLLAFLFDSFIAFMFYISITPRKI